MEGEDRSEAFVLNDVVADEHEVQSCGVVHFGKRKERIVAQPVQIQTYAFATRALGAEFEIVILAFVQCANIEALEAEHDAVMRRDVHHDLAVHVVGVVHSTVPPRCLNETCQYTRSQFPCDLAFYFDYQSKKKQRSRLEADFTKPAIGQCTALSPIFDRKQLNTSLTVDVGNGQQTGKPDKEEQKRL